MHGRLVGFCVAGNASGALAIRFFLRLADQGWTGVFVGSAQRRRGNMRAHRGEQQANSQRSPRREARNTEKEIAICHPVIHSAFSVSYDDHSQVLSFRAKRGIEIVPSSETRS